MTHPLQVGFVVLYRQLCISLSIDLRSGHGDYVSSQRKLFSYNSSHAGCPSLIRNYILMEFSLISSHTVNKLSPKIIVFSDHTLDQ